ncbi:MAG: hypothetical protein HRJ53_10635, partial [Acidobacteria bacterium Pan2503]|nr:hypothetical protein [Candidatus Acidoferrum panamensis]
MSTQFFGEPWPSGICDEGTQVDTPVGEHCELCGEPVQAFEQGTFLTVMEGDSGTLTARLAPVHRECSLRNVLGGIGHLQNHAVWCGLKHDPDAGYSYRESALK